MGDLQRKARAAGLWNVGLAELSDDEPGTRLSNLEYAPLAEIMGRLFWAPEVSNCQAPDVPNMIALQNCATPERKRRRLQPLLEARTRSAFGMTEPDVVHRIHQHRHADGPRRRRLRHQRTEIVDYRRGASEMQLPDRDGHDRFRCRPPAAFLYHRANRYAGHSPGAAAALDGLQDNVAPIGDLRSITFAYPAQIARRRRRRFKVAQIRLGAGTHPSLPFARSGCPNC